VGVRVGVAYSRDKLALRIRLLNLNLKDAKRCQSVLVIPTCHDMTATGGADEGLSITCSFIK